MNIRQVEVFVDGPLSQPDGHAVISQNTGDDDNPTAFIELTFRQVPAFIQMMQEAYDAHLRSQAGASQETANA